MKANPSGVAVDERPSQCLTMRLIAECTKTDSSAGAAGAGGGGNTDERADDILKTEILRLDWQRIFSIQNLDIFTNVRELYLQHNRIEKIEELGTLRSLEFLALGSNRIRRVENVRHLKKLQVLDLSNNTVEDVDTQELPIDLAILNLANNPCCQEPDLQQRVTCALSSLMTLDGEPVDPTLRLPADKESEGADRDQGDGSVAAVTLYVTVHSEEGTSNVVPLSFSSAGNLKQKAKQFCTENGLRDEAALRTLTNQMEEAISGNNTVRLDQAHRPPETPESKETILGCNDTISGSNDTILGPNDTISGSNGTILGPNGTRSGSNDTILGPIDTLSGSHDTALGSDDTISESNDTMLRSTGRLQAIVNLQKVRARALQESTASFEQTPDLNRLISVAFLGMKHKKHLLSTTRKSVEKKAAAAQGRSNDLEEGIRKILDDARSELQLRRVRVSAENKKFASDMRRRVDRVLAERREESEASSLKGVATSLSDIALVATNTHKTIDTHKTTATDEAVSPASPPRK